MREHDKEGDGREDEKQGVSVKTNRIKLVGGDIVLGGVFDRRIIFDRS